MENFNKMIIKKEQRIESQETVDQSVSIEICENAESVADHAAELILDAIDEVNLDEERRHLLLMLPTGNTPKRMYQILAEKSKEKNTDFSKVIMARVEGFAGVTDEYIKSFDKYIIDNFFIPNGIEPNSQNFLRIENIISPNELGQLNKEDLEERINLKLKEYDQTIKNLGGVDLAVLGLGGDAHVGDVQSSDLETKQKALGVRSTRSMNIENDFDEYTQNVFDKEYADNNGNLPSQYFATIGMNTLSQSKNLIIMATGDKKAEAVNKGVSDLNLRWERSLDPQKREELKRKRIENDTSPFGFLMSSSARTAEVKVIVDKAAASKLNK